MILTLRRHCVDTVQTLIDTDRNCTDLLIDTDAIGQDIELNSSLKTRDYLFFFSASFPSSPTRPSAASALSSSLTEPL